MVGWITIPFFVTIGLVEYFITMYFDLRGYENMVECPGASPGGVKIVVASVRGAYRICQISCISFLYEISQVLVGFGVCSEVQVAGKNERRFFSHGGNLSTH